MRISDWSSDVCSSDLAILLSTCDRVEIQVMHEDPQDAAGRLRALLMEVGGVSAAEDQIYALCDAAAVRHVFAVAAAPDSQVIAEPQVLSPVKATPRLAVAPERKNAVEGKEGDV